MFMKRLQTGLALAILCCAVTFSSAYAHKVTVFAWADGDRVFTESKFSGGKIVTAGKVEVFDRSGNLLLEGRTDDNGAFDFKTPIVTDLKIVLTAGMGHRNSWLLTAAELSKGEPTPLATSAAQPEPADLETPRATAPPVVGPGLTSGDIEAIVSRQLEAKIKPLVRMLAASQEKGPTMRDVVGGIGYIIGLVGLGAYVRYRRDRRPS
jgi:nickel transport protein